MLSALTTSYLFGFIILVVFGILFQKYLEKKARNMKHNNYNDVKQYLLNESSLAKSKKPIMWIYTPYEYNSRDWISFGSRSSYNLNQPYLNLCVKSIIKNCDQSFTICIVDDNSFAKLIPGWNIDLSIVSDPIVSYIRQMALAKLIYNYGGISVPISFLCFKDLLDMYHHGTQDDKMFVCENVNTNISSTNNRFYPDASFIGAKKNNEQLREFIDYMQRLISGDYTAQIDFLGNFDKWANKNVNNKRINLIAGTDVGTKTIDNKPVLVDDLLGEDYMKLYDGMYGIWIPATAILKRRNYEWFARLSSEQIFQSKFILAKYFVLALAPFSNNGNTKMSIIESLASETNDENNDNNKDWFSFWQVPSSTTLPVYGPKPLNIGDNVPQFKF
uniref:Uncharacterized protein n=1 Tax=viral metagenome TaxID=1070528 RepID=A0A6C0I6Z8_9ZZZZ